MESRWTELISVVVVLLFFLPFSTKTSNGGEQIVSLVKLKNSNPLTGTSGSRKLSLNHSNSANSGIKTTTVVKSM